MIQALAISNQTAIRAGVIKSLTDSDFMSGAKAMMIETLKEKLRNGIASFCFAKKERGPALCEMCNYQVRIGRTMDKRQG